jgi:hypothetical protein
VREASRACSHATLLTLTLRVPRRRFGGWGAGACCAAQLAAPARATAVVTVLSFAALLLGAALAASRDADASARAAAAAHAARQAPPPPPTHRLRRWAAARLLTWRHAAARAALAFRMRAAPDTKRHTALTLLRQAHEAARARVLGTSAPAALRRAASGR